MRKDKTTKKLKPPHKLSNLEQMEIEIKARPKDASEGASVGGRSN
jgi:hypothetical protein